jgi:hypothetical protein
MRNIVSVRTDELNRGDVVLVDDMRLVVQEVKRVGPDNYRVTFEDGWDVSVTRTELWERSG